MASWEDFELFGCGIEDEIVGFRVIVMALAKTTQ